jgi:hypothetical protein
MAVRLHARVVVAASLSVLAFGSSIAQTAAVRVRGTIESVDGSTLRLKSREGEMLTVTMADDVRISAVVKATLGDIAPGTFVGVAAVRGPGGVQRALEVLIFPEAMRGTGEGHRAWDLMPESTMTNATVVDDVSKVEGRTLTLKYKDGEQTIVVPSDAPVVTFAGGSRADLKKGAGVFIARADKRPDGTLTAARISVGRGIMPPM